MTVATHPFSGTLRADPTHSSVVFGVQHMQLSSFRGSFGDLDARLIGDESGLHLEGSTRVDSISITDPPELREHVVRGAEFFDADTYAEIRFHSDRVELAPDGSARVEGKLTMKGISKPVVATGTYEPPRRDPFGATRAALALQTVLDRREWNFTWQLPLPDGREGLGWTVEITLQLELVQEA